MPNPILKKNQVGGVTLPNFKTDKALVIKTIHCERIDRHIDQWGQIESPEIDPYKYSQLIFDEGAKAIQWRKDKLFNK